MSLEVEAPHRPEVGELLAYVDNAADHEFEPVADMHYLVAARGDVLEVVEDDLVLARVADARRALDVVYRRVYQRAFELASLRGWVRLHAAVIDLDEVRMVLVGPSGVGKTTMACQLLLDGVRVVADESVLVRGGRSLPVPRRLHVKPGTLSLLPELGSRIVGSPSIDGGAVTAVDLARLAPWTVTERPVGAVVVLDPDETPLRRVPTVEVLDRILGQVMGHQEGVAAAVREVSAVLAGAPCYRSGHRPLAVRAAELAGARMGFGPLSSLR